MKCLLCGGEHRGWETAVCRKNRASKPVVPAPVPEPAPPDRRPKLRSTPSEAQREKAKRTLQAAMAHDGIAPAPVVETSVVETSAATRHGKHKDPEKHRADVRDRMRKKRAAK